MRIGMLTGGGDVPGLNPCMKAIVYRAIDDGCEILGIRRGWAGLLYYNTDDPESHKKYVAPLTKRDVRTVDRTGGTFLHTSRTNPSKVKPQDIPDFLRDPKGEYEGLADFTPHVLRVLEHLGVEALIAIGGDDTLSYAARLHEEGFPTIGIPKTMDNDVFGTDYCIGFSTAVTRSVDLITNLRCNAGSHERIGVVELFGRNSGETSLIAAYLSGVDRAIISEVPFDPEKLAAFLMEDRRNNPSNYAMMTISEGARMAGGKIIEYGQADAYGHRKLGGIGIITAEAIKKITGQKFVYQQLSYLMRSGAPDSLDRMVALSFANLATDLAVKGETGLMVALQGGKYTTAPLDIVTTGVKRVDVDELYDMEEYRPKVASVLGKPLFLY
jgi:6-phosphofructokinase